MSIPRTVFLGGITVVSTVVVCFVAADRLTHISLPARPSTTVAAAPAIEPETTGTVTQGAEASDARPPRTLDGFDTERLNALMRGEIPPMPVPARTVARRR